MTLSTPRHVCRSGLTAALLGLCIAATGAMASARAENVATPPVAVGPVVNIQVQPAKQGLALNPLVLRGYNFGNWMPVTEFTKALSSVPAATLRFPAGNAGDDFDLNDVSLDTLAVLQKVVPGNSSLMVQTRVFGGTPDKTAANTPQDAAAAVKMAAERKLNVAIWEIGNEPDLYSKIRGDKTWNADRYCDVFRAQALAIKAVNPAAVIAGPAISGDTTDGPAFLERFVLRCGDVVDVLTWHIYPTGGEGSPETALASIGQFDATAAQYRALWADAKRNPLGHQRSIQYGVTEYGLSWRSNNSRFLADQDAAIWAAEGAMRMAENGINISHYFAYLATSFHGLLDLGGVPRPTYYGFGMLAGLQGKFVAAQASDDKIWVHAVQNGSAIEVVVINSHDNARPVALALEGYAVESVKYFDAGIVEEEKDLAELPAKMPWVLPAKAMAKITLKVASAP
jgi:hypothetical protein